MIVLLCGWWSGFCFVWCLLQGLLSWRTWTQHGGISVLLTGIMNHRWEWTNELTLLITEFKQFNTDLHWSRRKVMKYAVKELNKSFFVLAIIGHTHFLMGFLAFPFSRTVVNFVVWLHRCYTSCTIRWSIMLARSLKRSRRGLLQSFRNDKIWYYSEQFCYENVTRQKDSLWSNWLWTCVTKDRAYRISV